MPTTLPLAAGGAEAGAWRARWQNGIVLQDVTVLAQANGGPKSLQLRWKAEQNGQRDYTVFVQALDAGGKLVAQVDQQPQHRPTGRDAGRPVHNCKVVG